MSDNLADIIRAIPEEAFREPRNPLESLTSLERLRWLQQTAYFIWRHKGAAYHDTASSVPDRGKGASEG
ncbi:MAG: hypothetical protein PHU25_02620 [Deltaproteobacteria bacterium]|nr:hypothetical protein [Deltaproteobacteria bacterium]